MHEHNTQSQSEIRWPQTGTVEIGSSIDFVYIMRKDGNFAMSPVADRLASEYYRDEEDIKQILLEEYDVFFNKLTGILQWAYSYKGKFQLHLYDADELDTHIRSKAEHMPIVSLDPLMNQGVFEHKVSRGYYLGGKKDFGQVSRPGSNELSQQAHEISLTLNGLPIAVAEDDIFSGGSVIRSLNELINRGIVVEKLIPGIQVGKPSKLSDMGIFVDPVVTYETTDGADIFDKVDLGDPRDYLLGASGLVMRLPNGHYGRAPYILPFVSTTARAGIPQEIEKEFAVNILLANLEFYSACKSKTGQSLCLKHMDPHVVVLMNEMFGFDENTTMEDMVIWSINNIDHVWEITKAQGEFQEKLSTLNLPQNIVFVDVNGTLIPDDTTDDNVSEKDLELLQQTILKMKETGISVGFCSDSPLPQLQQLALKLEIDGPIVAENGNLIFYNGETLILNSLDSIDAMKSQIIAQAEALMYPQESDCIAPEFGGKTYNNDSLTWSFGANRETSITVFGPSPFIQHLGTTFQPTEQYSMDVSPEYNYFAIHPGVNYRENKGITLSLLSQYGHSVMMIGNSLSDWVDPDSGVQCAFVANSRISSKVEEKAAYISDKPLMSGVIDILTKLL